MVRSNATPLLKTASFPGSASKQFRVQVLSADGSTWQMYATFSHRRQADECWLKLTLDGHQARVVENAHSPVAA